MKAKIYTLGTGKRGIEELLEIIKRYKIETIFDVRRFPTSQFVWFRKENLEKIFKEKNIEYIHLGEELGGYRKGGYIKWMMTKTFQQGLEIVKRKAAKKITCILCAEKVPFRCHRRFISEELEKEGMDVIHIIDLDNEVLSHSLARRIS